MPKRLWIQAGMLIAVLAAAFIAITRLVPGGPSTPAASLEEGSEPVTAAPAGPPVDPVLLADIAALVTERSAGLPAPVAASSWLPVQLVAVTSAGAAIDFDYFIDIDIRRFDAPSTRRDIVPGFSTGPDVIFGALQFDDRYAAAICADAPLAALLARGVTATFNYYDRNDRRIAFLPASVRTCTAPAGG